MAWLVETFERGRWVLRALYHSRAAAMLGLEWFWIQCREARLRPYDAARDPGDGTQEPLCQDRSTPSPQSGNRSST